MKQYSFLVLLFLFVQALQAQTAKQDRNQIYFVDKSGSKIVELGAKMGENGEIRAGLKYNF